MASNMMQGDKGYDVGRVSNMDAFDKLPRVLRQALAQSDHNWSAAQCLKELRKPKAKRRWQFASAEVAAVFIATQDRNKHDIEAAQGIVAP